MHRRENFTAYEVLPEALAIYMSHNGPHFNKACCEFAVSQMYKADNIGRTSRIDLMTREEVNNLLTTANVKIKNNYLYDATYIANMVKADYYGSSILTPEHLAKYIKDTLDDADGMEGLTFNRWIADMKWLGIPIPWDEFL